MKSLLILCLLLSAQTLYSQSLSLFDIDASNFPVMRAKFYALDSNGNQIRPESKDLILKENGVERKEKSISCPALKTPQALSSVLVIDVSGSMQGLNITLAKAAAIAWVNGLPLGKSECAIASFDHSNYLNQDFTTNRAKLLGAINPLQPQGGTDYDMALLNPMAGGLLVSKNGKHQKVIVFLTDGQGSNPQINAIVGEANQQNCIIYCVTLGMSAPQSLKAIAAGTGGQVFENVTSVQEAEDVYRKILQAVQGSEPCEIIWQSRISCQAGNTNVELQWQAQKATDSYQSPQSTIAKLEFNPKSIKFADPQVGVRTEQKITVTARNADFNITNITSNNGGFDITPKNFILPNGQSIELTVSYTPADSGFNYCRFEIENTLCQTRLYASGGWKGKKPLIQTLKLIHPNGGEVFVAGSDTVITWEGISPDEPVKLEYSTNNGTKWLTLSESAIGLSYNWRVPRIASTQCLARVTAAAKSGSENGMVPIPAGTFQMGNIGTNGGSDETPLRSVTISRDFLMSAYEITQKQYEEVMGTNPSNFKGDSLPVETVSWYEAVEYCNKLSEIEGLDKCYSGIVCDWDATGYRLPTEAEWEYAAKAGTTTDFYNGDLTNQDCTPIDANLDSIGWYCGNAYSKTQEVGKKAPNDFGLYDMSGNVWEWCWDWYANYTSTPETDPKGPTKGPTTGSDRVIRGGSGKDYAFNCRSANRDYYYVNNRSLNLGFRVVTVARSQTQSDISDAVWSIVLPLPASQNVDMRQCLVGSSKDSVVTDFVRNIGSWKFRVDSIYFRGADANAFRLVSGVPSYSVAANNHHFAEFRFIPQKIGVHNADIVIITQTDTLVQTITGIGIAPQLQIMTTIIDFGKVEIGDEKIISDTVVLKNISTTSIDIIDTKQLSPDIEQFSVLSGDGGFTLSPQEERKVTLRFKPKYGGRTSGRIGFEYNGTGSPAIAQLFGTGIGGIITVPDDSGYAGERKILRIMMNNVKPAGIASIAPKYEATLRFQNTIMASMMGVNTIKNDSNYVTIQGTIGTNAELAQIPIIVGLGNVTETNIDIVQFRLLDENGKYVDYDFETQSGKFTLLGICEEGGTRLINPGKATSLMRIHPNPSKGIMSVDLELIEQGLTKVRIMDIQGNVMVERELIDAIGSTTVLFDMEKYGAGVYYIEVRTPTIVRKEKIMIEK